MEEQSNENSKNVLKIIGGIAVVGILSYGAYRFIKEKFQKEETVDYSFNQAIMNNGTRVGDIFVQRTTTLRWIYDIPSNSPEGSSISLKIFRAGGVLIDDSNIQITNDNLGSTGNSVDVNDVYDFFPIDQTFPTILHFVVQLVSSEGDVLGESSYDLNVVGKE